MASDGSVIIDTRMDTSGFDRGMKKSYQNLQREINKVENQLSKAYEKQKKFFAMGGAEFELTPEYKKALKEVERLETLVDKTYQKATVPMANLTELTPEYKKALKEVERLEKSLDNAYGRLRKFEKLGKDINSSQYKTIQYEISNIENRLELANEELEKLENSGSKLQINKNFKKLNDDLVKFVKELDIAKDRLENLESSKFQKNKTFASMEYDIENLKTKLTELKAEENKLFQNVGFKESSLAVESLKKAFEELGEKINTASKNISKFAGKSILNGFKKLGNSIKKFVSNMINLDKSTKRANYSMLKMLGTSVLFSTVFRAISAVANGFKDGMNNLVQYSDEANLALSALKSSLTQLKNSFATAFSPILSVVGPILVSFINLISRAVTAVSAFFSALSGKSTYIKAVSLQEDYAASLKDTSKNADSAKKSLNNYLSGLDELNVHSQDSEGGSSDFSISPENMFKEEEIPFPIASFAEKVKDVFDNIKKLFEEKDWDGLGLYIADLLNKGLQYIYDVLNWENVKEKVVPFIEGFTEFFNYFVIGFDWELLGRTIGTGINTIINTLNLLIEGINWKLLGGSFADGVNGLFSEVNWENLGNFLGNKFMIAWDMFRGFVYKLDYSEIGLSIAEGINGFLENIDLGEMVDSLSRFAVGLLETLTITIQNTNWELVGQQISEALKSIDWLGIAKGLWDAGTALIGGILDAFGELPAPVQLVIDLLAGFLVSSGLQGIVSFITSKLLPIIGNVIAFISGNGGVIGAVKSVASLLGTGGMLPLAVGGAVAALLLLIQNWDEVKAVMTAFDDFLQNVFAIDWTESFGALGEVFNAFSFILSDLWNNGIKKTFTGIIDFITGIFTGNWTKAWNGIKDIFSGVLNAIKTTTFSEFNIIIGAVNGLINAIEQGLNGVINLINGLSFDIPEWVPVFGGKKFSLNIPNITVPRIPYLATGAVIPPNAPFLAMLGDQKHGNNIEAPEDLIRKIVREETSGVSELIPYLEEIIRYTRETAEKEFPGERELVKVYDARKARNGYAF